LLLLYLWPVSKTPNAVVFILSRKNNKTTKMSIRRSATRRGPPPVAAPKLKKGYENVEQGVKQIYPGPSSDKKTDMDIVFVSGLGAHPVTSFKHADTNFNWVSDEDGIAREFQNARILLYHSESSWTGAIKVKQFLGNLAQTLLEGLKVKRENSALVRPITFIGHSMGGLVIAKV
jgi:triacylglycerol esterase/lipase EstA (alpha/beta hydrolase family)